MSTTAQARHEELVEQTARRYRDEGYEVVLSPSGSAFGWKTLFQPDLLARKGDETVVVEIASRKSLRQRPTIREFAREVDTHPNWRFEVVLSDELDEPEEGPAVGHDVIRHWLDETDRLGEIGQWVAATLLAAAALEATLRSAASARGVQLGRAAPREVLRSAASLGYITDDDLLRLESMWRIRNDLAHGFSVSREGALAPADVAKYFAATGRRLLDEIEGDSNDA